jgi:hypothetical protein
MTTKNGNLRGAAPGEKQLSNQTSNLKFLLQTKLPETPEQQTFVDLSSKEYNILARAVAGRYTVLPRRSRCLTARHRS